VRRIAPPGDVIRVQGFPYDPTCTTECRTVAVVAPPERRCPVDLLSARGEEPSQADLRAAETDERCTGVSRTNTPFSGPVVGSYEDYVRLVDEPSAAARAAIEAGGMVVFDADHVVDARGAVEVATYDATSGQPAGVRSVRVPAVHVPLDGRGYVTGWLSPEAAAAVGVPVGLDATVVQYDVPPDDDTEEAISAALADQGSQGLFRVERGYRDAYGIGLLALLVGSAVVTLGAAGVATGLAQADGRADQSTLAPSAPTRACAAGSPPSRRRWSPGSARLLGTASGFVPMAAFIYADTELQFVAPWTNLLVIAVAVPAVAAVAAGLMTRSRLPLSRRLAV
jgi:putative ABC transport system permease protein